MSKLRSASAKNRSPTIVVDRPDARDPIASVLRTTYATPDDDLLPEDMLMILQQIDCQRGPDHNSGR